MTEPAKSAIDELLDHWDSDAAWDKTEPSAAMNAIPKLHAKYARIMSKHVRLSKQVDYELIALRKFKLDYYNGRLSQTELAENNLTQFKFVLKQDAKDYVDADPGILTFIRKRAVHDEIVRICESILKELHSRTYQIKGYMDWEKFMSGV